MPDFHGLKWIETKDLRKSLPVSAPVRAGMAYVEGSGEYEHRNEVVLNCNLKAGTSFYAPGLFSRDLHESKMLNL
jgi:hypothetical protein